MKKYIIFIVSLVLTHIYTYTLYNKNKDLQTKLSIAYTQLDITQEMASEDCRQMIKYERAISYTNGCYDLLENLCSGRKACINNYKSQCIHLEF